MTPNIVRWWEHLVEVPSLGWENLWCGKQTSLRNMHLVLFAVQLMLLEATQSSQQRFRSVL